jgi:hypothetical protein
MSRLPRKLFATLLGSGALGAAVFALPQEPALEATAPALAAADLADLAWLAGHWRTEKGKSVSEELWLPPRAGIMLALNRTTAGETKRSFEYLRIEQRGDRVVYVASPGGRGTTDFQLTAIDEEARSATFENPQHDFPKKITYVRSGDALKAIVAGDGDQKFELNWELAAELK